MAVTSPSLPRCANCGVEIPWRPAVHRGKTYCCGGCVQGGPCYCSYDLATLEPYRQRAHGEPARRSPVSSGAGSSDASRRVQTSGALGPIGEWQ
jgi:hypothetical protein